ncbi:shikimate dehydrogenase substrate binding domain-containing protein [Sarocladium implicatum]|jgi:quinate dehydrogenase|nr:shikimate dehydrogenase substrate binding domain-containing protein [Sarocladium implicatum]
MATSEKKTLHLVGIGVTHSIAFGMHDRIAESLGLPWKFHSTECPKLEDALELSNTDSVAGLVVTMPYKNSIMPHLDELDELATTIGACNNVYFKPGEPRKRVGTNTDWRGIKGCLLEKGDESRRGTAEKPVASVIVGAGGASRAAVYALSAHLHSNTIYVLNRDDQEVLDLIRDSKKLPKVPEIIHVKTLEQAQQIPEVYYVVGTVPDLEPQTETEKLVAAMLKIILEKPSKGSLLDMCFKPRRTRMIKLAESLGWPCVEGTHVIGYQIEEQWRLWAGEEASKKLDKEAAWAVLLKAAEESKGINF